MKTDLKTNLALFTIFFKAGTFTFAGGLSMLPVIQKDVVDKYKMMPEEEFLEYATLSQTLPGVIGLNCASFVGRYVGGTIGMLFAGLGATISAFVLMILATILLQFIPQDGPIAGAFHGIRAASSAFILSAAYTLGKYNIKSFFGVILMLAAFVLVMFTNISAPIVVLGAGLAGYIYQRIMTKRNEKEKN
ncbi:MAG: chromate transporter [Clostridiales bacterium]|nr:chromate transporter [Clostridiales bacterium]